MYSCLRQLNGQGKSFSSVYEDFEKKCHTKKLRLTDKK
jgi:hypothetical protein